MKKKSTIESRYPSLPPVVAKEGHRTAFRMQFQTIQRSLFILFLIGVTLLFLWIVKPFFAPIFWAIILASIFYPLQERWLRVTRGRNIASTALTMVTICILVLLPLYWVGMTLVRESRSSYRSIVREQTLFDRARFPTTLQPMFEKLESLGIHETEIKTRIGNALRTFSGFLANKLVHAGQNVIKFLLDLFVMLYLLAYFLKKGPRLSEQILHLIPLGSQKERNLLEKFSRTVRATLKGTIIIGIVQGFIGGVLFAIAGISTAILWGTVMAILAILPVVGSALIWIPAAIALLLGGELWQGIMILLGGLVLINSVDNILRPLLVGKDTEMPDVLVLLSTLGGLIAFGASGFVIGPVIAAFFLATWEMFEKEHHDDLTEYG